MTLQPTRLCSTGNGRRHSTNSQSITPMSMETAATNTPSRLGRSRTQTNSARWRHFSGGPPGPPARIERSAEVTYTQNWPHEELIGNRPTGAAVVWSVISFVLLLAGVGGVAWYLASQPHAPSSGSMPRHDPLLGLQPTASQKATVKYFFVVAALWVVQVALGAIAAHYGVEGGGFYGIPLGKWLPYSIARTWHLQIGIFW